MSRNPGTQETAFLGRFSFALVQSLIFCEKVAKMAKYGAIRAVI